MPSDPKRPIGPITFREASDPALDPTPANPAEPALRVVSTPDVALRFAASLYSASPRLCRRGVYVETPSADGAADEIA